MAARTPAPAPASSNRSGRKPPPRAGAKPPASAPLIADPEPAAPVPVATSQRLADDLGDFDDAESSPAPVAPSPAPVKPAAAPAAGDAPAEGSKRKAAKRETLEEKKARLEREMNETPEQRKARLQAELDALNNRGKERGEPLRSSYLNGISARANALQSAIDALQEKPFGLDKADAEGAAKLLLRERDAVIREWHRLNKLRQDRSYEETSYLRALQFVADGDSFKHVPTPRGGKQEDAA